MKKTSAKKRNNRIKIWLILIMFAIMLIVSSLLIISQKSKDGIEGVWIIKEARSEDIVMTTDDAKIIGLNNIGYLEIKEGGDCKVKLLEREYEGKWEEDGEHNLLIKYDEVHSIHANIDKGGEMKATDDTSIEYILSK